MTLRPTFRISACPFHFAPPVESQNLPCLGVLPDLPLACITKASMLLFAAPFNALNINIHEKHEGQEINWQQPYLTDYLSVCQSLLPPISGLLMIILSDGEINYFIRIRSITSPDDIFSPVSGVSSYHSVNGNIIANKINEIDFHQIVLWVAYNGGGKEVETTESTGERLHINRFRRMGMRPWSNKINR